MKYILEPSLERIAVVKVAIALWSQDDVRTLIRSFSFLMLATEKRKEWDNIEKRVVKNARKLSQPGLLKEKILGCIKPIGLEILKWIEYHCTGYYLYVDLPFRFCWTPQGTIDRKRTAGVLMKDEHLDITIRYKLACIYCLEGDIRRLWNEIPLNSRRSIAYEDFPGEMSQLDIVCLWTYEMKLEDARLNNYAVTGRMRHRNPYQRAFEYAAESGLKAAFEYFFSKFTTRDIDEYLADIAKRIVDRYHSFHSNSVYIPKEDYTGILCFLLSQMDEEQEKEVFKRCRSQALVCFLEWPWQSLFMETVCRMWEFLSIGDYYCLSSEIIGKIRNGYNDFNYQNLFEEFWLKIPCADKKDIMEKPSGECLLSFLFEVNDEKTIKMIFQDLSLKAKHGLLISSGIYICENLILRDELRLFKLFIIECEPSEEIILKFKDSLKKHLSFCSSKDKLAKNRDKLDKVFALLDDFACVARRGSNGPLHFPDF